MQKIDPKYNDVARELMESQQRLKEEMKLHRMRENLDLCECPYECEFCDKKRLEKLERYRKAKRNFEERWGTHVASQ